MKQAARLNHPNRPRHRGGRAGFTSPTSACDRALGATLGEWLSLSRRSPAAGRGRPRLRPYRRAWPSPADGVALFRDLQLHNVLVGAQGQLQLGLRRRGAPATPEADARRAQRDDAERDVLAIGVLLQMLCGAPVLDRPT